MKTAKQFHDFFAAIPAWKWTTGTKEGSFGRRCAIGHLAHRSPWEAGDWKVNLYRIFQALHSDAEHISIVPNINDQGLVWEKRDDDYFHPVRRYRQWTAKGRILAALKAAMKVGL